MGRCNMKRLEKIIDIQTGEETIIERDETPDEAKERQEYELRAAKIAADEKAKDAARQVILDKLGITQEEASLLIS